jgi:hypothetical protein
MLAYFEQVCKHFSKVLVLGLQLISLISLQLNCNDNYLVTLSRD